MLNPLFEGLQDLKEWVNKSSEEKVFQIICGILTGVLGLLILVHSITGKPRLFGVADEDKEDDMDKAQPRKYSVTRISTKEFEE
jgi:hypothetical protein